MATESSGNRSNQYPHSVLSSMNDVADLRPWGDEKFSAALFDVRPQARPPFLDRRCKPQILPVSCPCR
jgi:hypothetical protein